MTGEIVMEDDADLCVLPNLHFIATPLLPCGNISKTAGTLLGHAWSETQRKV